ncbi:MAG TPA: diaminopimelate epimerase [Cryomorphaceae bacterium]|nr:diaminopimelate epimerase [Cryomorphaceae bacterium]
MRLPFEKYQGTGNDFVLIDNRNDLFPAGDLKLVKRICDRKFGVGSDGLMLIEEHATADFKMVFHNPDGSQSLCGNGSRCAVKFAKSLGLAGDSGSFETTDGFHDYYWQGDDVAVSMQSVNTFEEILGHRFIHTGSPHLIVYTENVARTDVAAMGSKYRYHPDFREMGGTNVNFVEVLNDGTYKVRTYERGVEAETLSCGTGVTAVALALAMDKNAGSTVMMHTRGGELTVLQTKTENGFSDIWLRGAATHVFSGIFHA